MRPYIRFTPALVAGGASAGVQVSGLTNLWLALAIWTVTGLLAIYALLPWLRRLHFRWPVVLERRGASNAELYPNTSPDAIVRHLEPGETYFKKKSIFVSEIGLKNPVISDVTFDECDIVGRAVVSLMDDVHLGDSTVYLLGDSYDEWFMEAKQDQKIQVGVVAFQRCHFRKCTFHSITFAGTPTYLEGLKKHFRVWAPLQEETTQKEDEAEGGTPE